MKIIIPLYLFLIIPSILCAENYYSGYTEPFRSLDVSFAEPGIISELNVKEGDRVTQGQVLASLNHDVLNAELAIAKERVSLKKDRYDKLLSLSQNAIASEDELKRAKSELTIEELTKDRIDAQIRNRTLISEINGVITDIHKDSGEGVSGVDTPILTLVEIDKLVLNVFIDFQFANKLKVGQLVPVIIEDTKDVAKATVDFISPDADKASKTVRVKLLIQNKDNRFPSGILAKVKIN